MADAGIQTAGERNDSQTGWEKIVVDGVSGTMADRSGVARIRDMLMICAMMRISTSPRRVSMCVRSSTSERREGAHMTFEELLDPALALLQRRGRMTYRTLQR